LVQAVQRVYGRFKAPVVTIGSDLSSLSAELLIQACESLRSRDAVIGPSQDGGYYLIGLRQLAPEVFEDIDWSTPAVFQQTLARLTTAGLSCQRLPSQRDIDTPEDFRALVRGEIPLEPSFKHTAAFLQKRPSGVL
jgi:glycosyltransferase A (GT-A) superfamily protein (DUF2064 family)